MPGRDETYSRSFTNSTLLLSATYDPAHQTLEMRFRNGSTYRYLQVPEQLWSQLLKADSAGEYFVKNIRARFEYAKIE